MTDLLAPSLGELHIITSPYTLVGCEHEVALILILHLGVDMECLHLKDHQHLADQLWHRKYCSKAEKQSLLWPMRW